MQEMRHGFNPWVGKVLWRRKWQPTQVFCLENPHGQRSLAGYSPWGGKESDTTEGQTFTVFFFPFFKWGLEYNMSL